MAFESYTISADFANGIIEEKFHAECAADATINQKFEGVTVHEGDDRCDISIASALTGAEKVQLDALVAAHDGTLQPRLAFHASSKLLGVAGFNITAVDAWEVVDGVITSPDFFVKVLSAVLGRIVGASKVTGIGAKLRVVEKGTGAGGADRILSDEFDLADTAGSWNTDGIGFNTNAPPSPGQNEYHLEAQLGVTGAQATSAEIRSVSMSLLELL